MKELELRERAIEATTCNIKSHNMVVRKKQRPFQDGKMEVEMQMEAKIQREIKVQNGRRNAASSLRKKKTG